MQSSHIDHGTSCPHLPPEIMLNIMSFVGTRPQHWENARLVSRDWANFAAPYIFAHISLAPWLLHRLEDLRSLNSISHYVRRLHVYSVALPEAWMERWHAAVRERRPPSETQPLWTPQELDRRYQDFLAVSQQQERFVGAVDTRYWPLQVTGKNLTCLENAIRSFHKLEKVKIADCRRYGYLLLPRCGRSKESKVCQELNKIRYFDSPHRSFSHVFSTTVLRTLGEAGKSLSCFRAEPIMLSNIESLAGPMNKVKWAITSTIAQLTHLQLHLERPNKGFYAFESWHAEWLVDVLAAATNMRKLDLALPRGFCTEQDILRDLWALHMPVLEKLILGKFYLTEGVFLDFLLHRGPRLKRVTLNRSEFLPERGQRGLHWWGEYLRVLTIHHGYCLSFIRVHHDDVDLWINTVYTPLVKGLKMGQVSTDDICHYLAQLLRENRLDYPVSLDVFR
ncbi:MAG: hypothetical protein LQ352_006734 [Teloschistes flavicans]|nr:MAG: hypothetical protein LQ352_006734 [Teloschistes flavicans]